MKTTKKINNSDNQSSSTMQKFFKAAPKGSIECASSSVKSVYVNALLEKLNRGDEEIHTSNENNSAPKPTTDHVEVNKSNRCESCGRSDKSNGCGDCDKWRSKYEETKKSQIKLSLKYTDLLLKYDELVQVASGTVRPSKNTEKKLDGSFQEVLDFDVASPAVPDSDVASQAVPDSDEASDGASQAMPASNGVSQAKSVKSDFFTENEIKWLQCLPLDKKKDSTFVLRCVEYLYKDNPACLVNKTLKGTRARFETDESGDMITVKPGKDSMTPEKAKRIQQLFIDRISQSKCLAGQFGERVKQTNLNKLIASAMKNAANKEGPKKEPSNQNANLNL